MNQTADQSSPSFRAEGITRPSPALMRYYALSSLLAGPFFFVPLTVLTCKYLTLKYRFDESGIAMQWGVLFRREIYLTHRRIQDIHLSRNIVQRWFRLATLAVQTASGSATPEMSIEGVLEAEPLRDYLYAKMRGARGDAGDATDTDSDPDDEALVLLCEIRDSMRALAESKASADRSAGNE